MDICSQAPNLNEPFQFHYYISNWREAAYSKRGPVFLAVPMFEINVLLLLRFCAYNFLT